MTLCWSPGYRLDAEKKKKKGKGELTKSDFYGSSGFIKLECCVLLFINELVPYALTVLVNSW